MLVVPVPRPASLNEVVSAPVVLLTLLLANRKCGLSASAAVAVSITAESAVMRMNAMRRIVYSPLQVPNDMAEKFPWVNTPFTHIPTSGFSPNTNAGRPARGNWEVTGSIRTL